MSNGNERTGVITQRAEVRSTPGDSTTTNRTNVYLEKGTQVQILDDGSVDANSHRWYHVIYQQRDPSVKGYVRNDFIQETTQSQQHTQLKVIYGSGTWFKANTEDASQLGNDLKVFIGNNTVYNILSGYTEEKSHYRFTLADGQLINGKNTWYVYKPHVEIK